jgi:chemotaxis signal transduction protein
MKTAADIGTPPAEELQLLTFTVMGVRMGVDTAQVGGILNVEEADAMGLFYSPLHELTPFRPGPAGYDCPRVLLIKGETPPCGVLVGAPDDMPSFCLDSLRSLPPLVEASCASSAIWGVAIRNEEVILLLDFDKLPRPRAGNYLH